MLAMHRSDLSLLVERSEELGEFEYFHLKRGNDSPKMDNKWKTSTLLYGNPKSKDCTPMRMIEEAITTSLNLNLVSPGLLKILLEPEGQKTRISPLASQVPRVTRTMAIRKNLPSSFPSRIRTTAYPRPREIEGRIIRLLCRPKPGLKYRPF